MAIIATVSSLTKKARGSLTVDLCRACSDKRSKKDKCSNGTPESMGRVRTMQSIHHRSGQEKQELL